MKTKLKFNNILCPIDFDVNSLAALEMARELTRENRATLHVLHVVMPPYQLLISAPFLADRERHHASIRLNEIGRDLLRDVEHCLVLKVGDPAEKIINTAAEIEADLVVMATHGRTGMPRLFLGSVAEKVVRESSCPVLTFRTMPAHDREHPHATGGAASV
jgi:universal stress protein A